MENLIETQEYKTALAQFQQGYPEYATTQALDELRATEYARLDAQGMVYLDYTGGGLYAESQIQKHMDAAEGERLRQPAFLQPELDGSPPTWWRKPGRRCSSISTPRRMNMW